MCYLYFNLIFIDPGHKLFKLFCEVQMKRCAWKAEKGPGAFYLFVASLTHKLFGMQFCLC